MGDIESDTHVPIQPSVSRFISRECRASLYSCRTQRSSEWQTPEGKQTWKEPSMYNSVCIQVETGDTNAPVLLLSFRYCAALCSMCISM